MPESPAAVRSRYLDMDLPIADVLILTDEKPFSRYFDAVLEAGAPPKLAANWVLGDVMAHSKVRDDRMNPLKGTTAAPGTDKQSIACVRVLLVADNAAKRTTIRDIDLPLC